MTVAATDTPMIALEIARYLPGEDEQPHFQTYELPFRADWVVLDALNHLKNEVDSTLSYRWSCRMGVCGSCGVMVNGVPVLACASFLRDHLPGQIRVEPLANFPVERDLVIDLDDFLAKLPTVKPWVVRDVEEPLEQGEYRQTPAQLAEFKQLSMCINCMLCYAACPVYQDDAAFLGPAALALAQRYNHDSRDDGAAARREVIWTEDGVWDCTFVGECSVVCPKDVDPAGAIQQAKLESTLAWYRSFLMPFGRR